MTVLTICNVCLTALEDEPIQDFTDSKGGEWCDRNFDHALSAVLQLYPWNVNAKWTTLTENVAAPPFKFLHSYRLPDDCLDIRAILDPNTWKPIHVERQVVERDLYTDLESPIYLQYGRRIERDELDNELSAFYPLDPLFEECVAYKLGAIIAKALTGEQGDREYMEERLRLSLLDASARDAQNNIRYAIPDRDDWTEV